MTAPAPPQGPPADHRLIAPAAAAWAAAAAALVTDGRTVAVAVALAVATACVLVLRARARPETSAPSGARGRAASCGFAAGARPAADGPHSPDGMADRANGSRRRSTGRAPQGARVQVASCGSAAWARPAAHNPQAAPTEPTHHSNGRDRITKPHRTAAAAATAPAIAITIAAVLLCAAASAASAALTAADTRRGPLPPLAARYAEVTLEVTVTSDPRSTRPHVRGASRAQPTVVLEGEATRLLHGGRETAADGTAVRATALRTPVLVIAHPSWLGLLPSTKVKVAGRLAPPARQGDRVAAVVRVAGQGPPEVVGRPDALQRVAARLRAGLRSATDGLEPDARALLPGLVVGDTSRIPPDLEEAFRATDLTHLLAVSGSNLAILITVLVGPPHLAARAERRGLAARFGVPLRLTAVLGAVLVLGFVVVCRPEPSVLRAAVCGLITLMAIGTGRRRSLLPALAAAVLLLVLYDPWLSRSYGFALSVLATGALITLAPRWGDALRRRGVPARAAEALAAAAAAQAVCGPVIAVMAARVSLVAVPCNLLAELAVAPATVLGFAALVTAPVAPPLAQGLAWLAGWPTSWAASVARTGADLPGAELGWLGGWPGGLLLAVVTATAVVAARGASRRPWLCAACALLLMIAVIRPAPLTRVVTGWPPPGWRFAACDVGQGDALVLAAGEGRAVVVDAGPEPRAVDRCLRALGVERVPLLILSHFHADHVDGLPGVLRGRAVGAIETTPFAEPPGQVMFVRRTAEQAGIPVVEAVPGERRRLGELSWEVLWPPSAILGGAATAAAEDGPNDASVTLLVHSAGLSLLLLGDLEPPAQRALLEAHPELPSVDVLKVAHHGSAYQDPELIHRLRPRLAVVSVGAGNPYGHPSPRTLAELGAQGAAVLRTDTDGPVAVTSDATAVTPP